MPVSLKINSAILICAAFIFRLLFVNIGIISSLHSHQSNGFTKSNFSTKMKRRKHFEAPANARNLECSVAEICEEDDNEDSQLKSNPFLLLQVLYSLVADKISNQLERITSFHHFFSYTSSHRYLAFRTFRI